MPSVVWVSNTPHTACSPPITRNLSVPVADKMRTTFGCDCRSVRILIQSAAMPPYSLPVPFRLDSPVHRRLLPLRQGWRVPCQRPPCLCLPAPSPDLHLTQGTLPWGDCSPAA